MTFGERLKEIRNREDKKITQQQLADLLGIDRSAVAKWETVDVVPPIDVIKQIAAFFDVSIDYLTGFDRNIDIIDINPTVKIPLYERIQELMPLGGAKSIFDYIDIPSSSLEEGKEYFCSKVEDSSMSPKYLEGDILIIERNKEFKNGQDCILFINDSDAVLRRVIKQDDGLLLQPLNKAYESEFYDIKSVEILGIIRGLLRRIS